MKSPTTTIIFSLNLHDKNKLYFDKMADNVITPSIMFKFKMAYWR